MDRTFTRLVQLLDKRYEQFFVSREPVPFGLRVAGGPQHTFGPADPAFTLVVKDPSALTALRRMSLMDVGEAYLKGALDVEGDFMRVLSVRNLFSDRHPVLWAWKFIRPVVMGQVNSDARWIAEHYDEDPEFFLKFLDNDFRCYSQGVFERDDEPLEAGIRRKLEFAWDQIGVKEGDRVLDVGGGWGAWTQFAGERGVRVTSLTISRASEKFINGLIGSLKLPCRVVREHLFAHQPEVKYDAIVNLGVTEHLPDYHGTLRKYASLLKPGGRVCLDASATRRKYAVSAFFERHIFPGNGSPVCIHDYLAQVAASPFSVMGVYNDTHNYELTTRHWAQNLDAHREEIEQRFGKTQYRRFQVYLWGCVDAFRRDVVQAYRWVLELTGDPGDPRRWRAG
ncbi:MAG TPA: class I SAM-dependent methyltransferase [Longimicrobium sp.]|nr:class I SAM-dependent methyltransferase [Longimicrobium sp.]